MKAEDRSLNGTAPVNTGRTETITAARAIMGDPSADNPSRRLTLSTLLRGVGGLVVVIAFTMFLFQGWQEGDLTTRYLLLLGNTLVLSLAGFTIGHWIGEAKGARLFIALALAAVPVNFAFLGGLSYPFWAWDSVAPVVPAGDLWQPTVNIAGLGAAGALWMTLGAAAVLASAVFIGFLVLARRSALPLTATYLAANALLLVPARDQLLISLMLAVAGIAVSLAIVALRRRDASLATGEGTFARFALILPLLVLGGRSVWLYAPGELFFATVSFVVYLGLRQAMAAMNPSSGWTRPLEWLAVGLQAFMAGLIFVAVIDGPRSQEAFALPIAGAVFAALLTDLSMLIPGHAKGYRSIAAHVLLGAIGFNLVAFGGLGNAAMTLTGGIAAIAYAYAIRSRMLFGFGALALLVGLGHVAIEAVDEFTLGGWSGLVLIGVATIAVGSLIERHGERLRTLAALWQRHFDRAPRD